MAVLLLLIGILPPQDVAEDRVDAIEHNHFYDDQGREVFTQVIFWDGCEVVAWRLWRNDLQTPWRDWRRGGYVMIWNDADRLRVVRAPAMRETWTQHDPELENRERCPPHLRRGLKGERPCPTPEPSR